jgi:hypothetical protein
MKQETLEEAAEKWYDSTEENKGFPKIQAFNNGAKWQQERMYSEEDMEDYAEYKQGQLSGKNKSPREWFEKFKKNKMDIFLITKFNLKTK